MELRQIVGENVKKYRLEQGLTQQVLAVNAQISISYLRNIEHGTANPTADIIDCLAYSLGIKPETLMKEPNMVREIE